MEELILKERKFREDLAELINKSEIPAIMMTTVFKEALSQLIELEEIQYKKAKENTEKIKERK